MIRSLEMLWLPKSGAYLSMVQINRALPPFWVPYAQGVGSPQPHGEISCYGASRMTGTVGIEDSNSGQHLGFRMRWFLNHQAEPEATCMQQPAPLRTAAHRCAK